MTEGAWAVGDFFIGKGGGTWRWKIISIFQDQVIAEDKNGDRRIWYFDQMERPVH